MCYCRTGISFTHTWEFEIRNRRYGNPKGGGIVNPNREMGNAHMRNRQPTNMALIVTNWETRKYELGNEEWQYDYVTNDIWFVKVHQSRQTRRQARRQVRMHACRQAGRQAGRQASRQAGTQALTVGSIECPSPTEWFKRLLCFPERLKRVTWQVPERLKSGYGLFQNG